MDMPSPRVKVVVHPTKKGWSWTQVARNGAAQGVAPKTYDSKGNAKRAGDRQVTMLNGARDCLPSWVVTPDLKRFAAANPYAELVVVDKDPGYV